MVRWGLPIARTLHDLAAAATIGLLVVGTFLVPPERRSDQVVLAGARLTMVRTGAVAARCWFAAAAAVALLAAADATGSGLSTPGFLTVASSFWTQTELGQTLVAVCVGAALAAIGATVARTVVGSAWAAGLALLTLVPLALGGHAAGSLDHGNSVDSLLLHLVGVCLWVGGLAALLGFARVLGPRLPVVARRYSTLAGWSFVLVAMSGLVNAYLRLGGMAGLTSTYGLLVVGKATALLVLGTAGWLHRRATIPGLTAGPPKDHWFAPARECRGARDVGDHGSRGGTVPLRAAGRAGGGRSGDLAAGVSAATADLGGQLAHPGLPLDAVADRLRADDRSVSWPAC